MTPDEELRRAEGAERLTQDPLFQEARKRVYDDLGELRRRVSLSDDRMHSRLILMEQLAGRFFDYFEEAIQTGKLARKMLDDQRTLAERMKASVVAFQRYGRNF